jgi:hypothetical protein
MVDGGLLIRDDLEKIEEALELGRHLLVLADAILNITKSEVGQACI